MIASCVRMLSKFGLHHQGVFRVSGSQVEINGFKDAFERGAAFAPSSLLNRISIMCIDLVRIDCYLSLNISINLLKRGAAGVIKG